MSAEFTPEDRLAVYELMVLGREFELQMAAIFARGDLGGWFHSCIGHEATGAVLSVLLREADHLVPYHRSRVSAMGKGMSPRDLAADMMGRADSPSRGRAGETHINDYAHRMYGTTGVLGSNIPIGAGVAYGVQVLGREEVVACGFGEGTTNRGAFHEALNMAAIWDLPVVFICENNLYAEFSAAKDQTRITDIADRAIGYGIPGVVVDGNDPDALYPVLHEALDRARRGEGPTLVESKTYRQGGHYEGDPQAYRDKAEVAEWIARDPVPTYRRRLLEEGICDELQLAEIEERISGEVAAALGDALAARPAGADEVFGDVYAEEFPR